MAAIFAPCGDAVNYTGRAALKSAKADTSLAVMFSILGSRFC